MVLSRNAIRSRIKDGNITIKPFSEGRLTPNGYDISLSSEVYAMKKIDEPVDTMNENSLEKFLEKREIEDKITLEPLEPISILSKEKIGISTDLLATLEGRSSLGKMGVFPHFGSGIIDVGFGFKSPQQIVFTLLSCNPNPVVLYPDQPVGQIMFYTIESPPEGGTKYSEYETSVYPDFEDQTD